MLALALMVIATGLPTQAVHPDPAALTQVVSFDARFVKTGALGERIAINLRIDAPEPTQPVRLVVQGQGHTIEVMGRAGGRFRGAVGVQFSRAALGSLARYEGQLMVTGYVDTATGWRKSLPVLLRSVGIDAAEATLVDRAASAARGMSRRAVRQLMGTPDKVEANADWYGDQMMIFDAAGRFDTWQPMGC